MSPYVKRRSPPEPGSIPEALGMFRAEVRFYREIAPVVGVRVPHCYRAEESVSGTLLELEDLSAWRPGAEPTAAAGLLRDMHRRWAGEAPRRWPWLRPIGAAIGLVEELYIRTWPLLDGRGDLPPGVLAFGARMAVAGRVIAAEQAIASAGPLTLVHGDAQLRNMRTSPNGPVALLDWEDISAAPGVLDLAWLLTSSVDPVQWDDVIAAYGRSDGIERVLPAVMIQGLLSLTPESPGSPEALGWSARLTEAGRRLG